MISRLVATLAACAALALPLGGCAKSEASDEPRPAATLAADSTQAAAHLVSFNTTSHKYHERGCRYYDCQNCVTVAVEEAERQGGVPCKKCH